MVPCLLSSSSGCKHASVTQIESGSVMASGTPYCIALPLRGNLASLLPESFVQAQEPGLSSLKVHKSRLEREKDAATAAAAAARPAASKRATTAPIAGQVQTFGSGAGSGSLGDMVVRNSRLEREKAAAVAAAASDGSNPRTPHPFARGPLWRRVRAPILTLLAGLTKPPPVHLSTLSCNRSVLW